MYVAVVEICALCSQEPGARHAAYGADNEKCLPRNTAESHDVTEYVLWKAWNQIKDEGDEDPLMFRQVFEAVVKSCLFYIGFDQRPEIPACKKCGHAADGQPNGGVD